MSLLYRFEVKGIQKWILSGAQVRDLVGGSALIENLTNKTSELAKAFDGTIIQATSGAMTAKFPDREKTELFASELPHFLHLVAPGLPVVQAWVEEDDSLQGLFKRLAQKRNRYAQADMACGPWVARTGRSGEPAIEKPRSIKSDARKTMIDAATLVKEFAYRRCLLVKGVVTGDRPWDDFVVDIDQWPGGPVAVIHADGSGIGERLIAINREGGGDARLTAFSEALKRVTLNAIKEAVDTLPLDRHGKIYARPIVSAGDDLTYVVPASHARRFCIAWMRAFEDGSRIEQDAIGGRLVAGAGIAIVHGHHPFARAYQMAETLCGAAKKALKARNETSSVLAMRRITTSLEASVLTTTLAWRISAQDDALERLKTAVMALPRGTLRTWLTAFEAGETTKAQKLWRRAKEVADHQLWQELTDALSEAGADPQTGAFRYDNSSTLALGDAKTSTPVLDALALARLERGTV